MSRPAVLASVPAQESPHIADDTTFVVPPDGASPAGDLQRRLARAALRNFYTSADPAPSRRRGALRHLAIAVGVAVASWSGVFGLGTSLLR